MYNNFKNMNNKNLYVNIWLLLITFLLSGIIIVGGLTRLTDSGLSITRWDLISGIIPPLTLKDWEKSFYLYKQIPEFKLINFSMTLDEFKIIFWWEYAHRLLGRILGLFFILPLIYFTFKKKFKKNLLISLYFIFFLILLQGLIGWYMVQSGLTDRTDVSHYRLSVHLTLAFIILISVIWNFLKYNYDLNLLSEKRIPYYLPHFFLIAILIQISTGALVSGLDAGQIYNTWPLMNESYFPDDSSLNMLYSINAFSTPSLVQFIHRNIAYLIFLIFLLIIYYVFKNSQLYYLKKITLIIFIFLLFQIALGVLTIVSQAQLFYASMHQLGSVFLIASSLILVFKNSKFN